MRAHPLPFSVGLSWQPCPPPWLRQPRELMLSADAATVGVFSRGKRRISGSLSCGAREVRSPCPWRGGLRGFLELRRPWGFSPEARGGSQGASRAAPGKSGLHARGEGERVLALEIWYGNRQGRGRLVGCRLWGRTESDMTEAI